MKKSKGRFKRILESKLTTLVAVIILLTPFLVFGFIIYRDSSQTGEPVLGSRFETGLNPAITQEQLDQVESKLVDESIISKKVTLKVATLRIYLEVDVAVSKEDMKLLADATYESVTEVLDVETYFTLSGNKKQYDLEINVYNNSEDRDSEEFVYYQIVKTSGMEQLNGEFVTDATDPEFKEEVLENLAEKLNPDKEEEPAAEEEDTGGG
ncbi:MAG: hypothetical protein GX769_03985 [Erysipelothrix sp.]|nr:hypothetical protein [Erysipelothrix sp.]